MLNKIVYFSFLNLLFKYLDAHGHLSTGVHAIHTDTAEKRRQEVKTFVPYINVYIINLHNMAPPVQFEYKVD